MAKSKVFKKAYTCGVNWQHDLCDDNAHSIEIYGSIKALQKNRTCWEECGIVELNISVAKWVVEQDLFRDIRKKTKKSIDKK